MIPSGCIKRVDLKYEIECTRSGAYIGKFYSQAQPEPKRSSPHDATRCGASRMRAIAL